MFFMLMKVLLQNSTVLCFISRINSSILDKYQLWIKYDLNLPEREIVLL